MVPYHCAMAYCACVHLPGSQPEQAPEHCMPYRRSLHVSNTTQAGMQDIKESYEASFSQFDLPRSRSVSLRACTG